MGRACAVDPGVLLEYHLGICIRAAVLLLLLECGVPLLAEEDPLVVRVNRAIDRSAANLVSRQAEDGSFSRENKVHPLGRTALCTFALLHAGHPRDHPAVRKALACLGISGEYGGWKKPISTYEAGCVVLLHIENLEYCVHFQARLSDKEGKTLGGVTVSTSPRGR
jgi:hypothetical protein